MRLRVVELAGSPRQRGREHGKLLHEDIHRRLAETFQATFPGRAPSDVFRRLAPRIAAVERATSAHAPHLLEEIQGIAEGAELSFQEILLLTGFEAFEADDLGVSSGCTSIATATDGRTVVAQNWDGGDRHARYLIGLRLTLPDGTRQLLLASAGGLGWSGMNSHGVALVNSDLLLAGRAAAPPSQVTRRLALEQRTVHEALDVLRRVPAPAGRSYLLGDRSGALAVVEVSSRRTPDVRMCRGVAWHANHVESEALAVHEDREALGKIYPSTLHRGQRAAALLSEGRVSGVSRVAAVLSDHDGFPLSVCKHASGSEPSRTVASIIFDLKDLTGHFALGTPCSSDYRAIPV